MLYRNPKFYLNLKSFLNPLNVYKSVKFGEEPIQQVSQGLSFNVIKTAGQIFFNSFSKKKIEKIAKEEEGIFKYEIALKKF